MTVAAPSPPVSVFPSQLHACLMDLEEKGLGHIASFQPHGRCFVVHKRQMLVDTVLSSWFHQTKYASFQRQLNMYGFQRIASGPDKHGYWHPSFLRDRPELSGSIPRLGLKGTGPRKAASLESPNFYATAPLVAASMSLAVAAVGGRVHPGDPVPTHPTTLADLASPALPFVHPLLSQRASIPALSMADLASPVPPFVHPLLSQRASIPALSMADVASPALPFVHPMLLQRASIPAHSMADLASPALPFEHPMLLQRASIPARSMADLASPALPFVHPMLLQRALIPALSMADLASPVPPFVHPLLSQRASIPALSMADVASPALPFMHPMLSQRASIPAHLMADLASPALPFVHPLLSQRASIPAHLMADLAIPVPPFVHPTLLHDPIASQSIVPSTILAQARVGPLSMPLSTQNALDTLRRLRFEWEAQERAQEHQILLSSLSHINAVSPIDLTSRAMTLPRLEYLPNQLSLVQQLAVEQRASEIVEAQMDQAAADAFWRTH